MTKTISIYAAQILLGMVAIAAGYAKLAGTLGMSLGHVASATAAPAHALTSTAYQSSHDAGAGQIQIFRPRTEWDI